MSGVGITPFMGPFIKYLELDFLQKEMIGVKFVEFEITHRPAFGMMRLIERNMLYVRCVGLCLRSLHVDLHKNKINIPHYSDSQSHFCVAG